MKENVVSKISLGLIAFCLPCLVACGCRQAKPATGTHISLNPSVRIASPEMRTIRTRVTQPGVIEPYEQTALFSKVAGFVQKWNVDIGAHVKKDDLLAEILVPELKEEHHQKEAQVEQDKAMVNQAETLVKVAQSNVQSAADAVEEAQANIKRYQADVERWEGELNRLTKLVKDNVVNPEVLAETKNQAKSSQSAYESAAAAIKTKQSQLVAAETQVEKTKADLVAAQARVKVSEAEERRLAALVAYTKISAPYDGVVTARNVNTGDFVRPASGDASGREGNESGSGRAAPLFVVARTNPVMFVLGVPEVDAPYVSKGSKAKVRVQSLAGREFDVQVSRTSLALNSQSRTLQAEIDLANPNNELLPGMYAYGSVDIERSNVLAIPVSAIVQIGNRMCCYMVVDGKAVRTPIQTGVSDGTWTEVVKKNADSAANGEWVDFTSGDEIIVGDLSEIGNGKQVTIESAK